MALSLVDILFDQDCLRRLAVCGSRDSSKEALDPRKIEVIRSNMIASGYDTALFSKFSIQEGETEKEAWQKKSSQTSVC